MRTSSLATLVLLSALALPVSTPPVAAQERDLTVEQTTAATAAIAQAGSLKVSIQTDRPDATYAKGEVARLFVTANEDAYVSVFDIGPGGQVTRLFPNAYQTDNHLLAGRPVEIAGGDTGAHIAVSGPTGRELIKVIASDKPLTVIPESALQGRGFFKELQGGVPALARNLEVAANDTPKARKLVTSNFILHTVESHAANESPAFIVIPTAAPAPAPVPATVLPVVIPQASPAPAPAPRFPLLVATDKQSYKLGETVTLAVTSLQACYLTVLDIKETGEARQLFPNKLVTNNALAAYQTALISGGNAPVAFKLDGPVGTERIVALCAPDAKPLFALAPIDTATFAIASDRAEVTKTLTITPNEPGPGPGPALASATLAVTVTQ